MKLGLQLLTAALALGQVHAYLDTLKTYAGTYQAELMYGGTRGTWGNGGSVSIEITCEGEIKVGGGQVPSGSIKYDGGYTFEGITADGAKFHITGHSSIKDSYYFRDDATNFPGDTCSGACFTGYYQPSGSGALDLRGYITGQTQW